MTMFSREWAVMMRHGTDMSHQLTHVRRLDVDENGNRKEMSATAIGFLVPLFVLFLIGPFCCVFCVRKRRRRPNPRATPVTQIPTTSERREDARKKLKDVTQISKVTGYQKYAYMGDTKQEAAVDASSILERECIICLSTLYPPCAPEPVQTAFHPRSKETGTPSAVGDGMPVTKAPSVSETSFAEKEQILKLKICGHEFHAECLMSWFMIHKYSCPMCRAVYFQLGEDEHAENAGGENRSSATRYGREDV